MGLKEDIAEQKAYLYGLRAGWNYCAENEGKAFDATISRLDREILEAKKMLRESKERSDGSKNL